MKILKKTGAILVTLIYLLGSTGISFYSHTCSSSKINKTIVYPGLFKSAVSCCCSSTSDTDNSTEVDTASCCKSATTIIKLFSRYIPSVNTITVSPEATVEPCLSLQNEPVSDKSELSATSHGLEFYPPPPFGRRLLHFLHQIKVPSDSFLA